MKRFLTKREADRCEQAKEPVCHCRCGGVKHGAKRVSANELCSLPIDDPHYVPEYGKPEVVRLLKDARDGMKMPSTPGREEAMAAGKFDEWLEQSNREMKAFREAQDILSEALKRVQKEGLCLD